MAILLTAWNLLISPYFLLFHPRIFFVAAFFLIAIFSASCPLVTHWNTTKCSCFISKHEQSLLRNTIFIRRKRWNYLMLRSETIFLHPNQTYDSVQKVSVYIAHLFSSDQTQGTLHQLSLSQQVLQIVILFVQVPVNQNSTMPSKNSLQ